MSEVELRGVRKSFDQTEVVHGIDLVIRSGELLVFVGPSGCGKSTLLRLICGLEHLSGGDVRIGGTSMRGVNPARREVAMVFQSYALYPHMNVSDNMGFALRMAGMGKTERGQRVREAARILRLEEFLNRRPKQLSGGQRQRVAIGRAIVRNPRVFLFDEPLSNLDAELRVQMRLEICSLHRQLGATMVYVTHDQIEAMTMADRIAVLRDGRIEQLGTPAELYSRPDNRFVAGFIGSPRMNLLSGRVADTGGGSLGVALDGVDGQPLALPATRRPVAAGERVTLGIRPEHFLPAAESPYPIEVEVTFRENLGGSTMLHAPQHPAGAMVIESRAAAPPGPGRLTVGLDPAQLHLFAEDGAALALRPRPPSSAETPAPALQPQSRPQSSQ